MKGGAAHAGVGGSAEIAGKAFPRASARGLSRHAPRAGARGGHQVGDGRSRAFSLPPTIPSQSERRGHVYICGVSALQGREGHERGAHCTEHRAPHAACPPGDCVFPTSPRTVFFNTRGWIHYMGTSLLAWCGVPGDGSVRGVGWMAPNTPLQQGLGGVQRGSSDHLFGVPTLRPLRPRPPNSERCSV